MLWATRSEMVVWTPGVCLFMSLSLSESSLKDWLRLEFEMIRFASSIVAARSSVSLWSPCAIVIMMHPEEFCGRFTPFRLSHIRNLLHAVPRFPMSSLKKISGRNASPIVLCSSDPDNSGLKDLTASTKLLYRAVSSDMLSRVIPFMNTWVFLSMRWSSDIAGVLE